MGKINHPERELQKAIVKILRLNNIFVFSTHNGARMDIITAKIEKSCGMVSGVSDLIILLYDRVVFVELKDEKGRQSDTQKEFEKVCKERKLEYYIWRNIEDCLKFINNLKDYEK